MGELDRWRAARDRAWTIVIGAALFIGACGFAVMRLVPGLYARSMGDVAAVVVDHRIGHEYRHGGIEGVRGLCRSPQRALGISFVCDPKHDVFDGVMEDWADLYEYPDGRTARKAVELLGERADLANVADVRYDVIATETLPRYLEVHQVILAEIDGRAEIKHYQ